MEIKTDKIMVDLRAVVSDAEDLLKATAGQTGEHIEKLRIRAEESLGAARTSLQATGNRVGWSAMNMPVTPGTMLSTLYAFTPDFGRSFLLKAFCIIVLGGMESFTGVAAGAFVLALLENALAVYTTVPTSFQDAISFTLLVVVLVALPQGLPGLLARLPRRGRELRT